MQAETAYSWRCVTVNCHWFAWHCAKLICWKMHCTCLQCHGLDRGRNDSHVLPAIVVGGALSLNIHPASEHGRHAQIVNVVAARLHVTSASHCHVVVWSIGTPARRESWFHICRQVVKMSGKNTPWYTLHYFGVRFLPVVLTPCV